jgi:hypothetical protein
MVSLCGKVLTSFQVHARKMNRYVEVLCYSYTESCWGDNDNMRVDRTSPLFVSLYFQAPNFCCKPGGDNDECSVYV